MLQGNLMQKSKRIFIPLLAGLLGLVGLTTQAADAVREIFLAGASFPYPLYAKWAEAYAKETGVQVNHQSIGSGGGIQQIKAGTVEFGASDAPLEPKELDPAGLLQFPMIMGGVVSVVKIPGIASGELKLDGFVLADIFLGKITHWNDPRIQALNKSLKLPSDAITVVHRTEGSGTTWIFTNYLSKLSTEWASKVGNDKSVAWPVGIGGKGNEGVASSVQRIKGSIGYVEYAYALQNKMDHVQIKNRDGNFVHPDTTTFQAATANADWSHSAGFYTVLTDQPGKESWPITGASFILLHKLQTDPAKGKAILDFFDWAYHHGDSIANSLGYVPIPANVVGLVERTWRNQIRDAQGQPVWSGKD